MKYQPFLPCFRFFKTRLAAGTCRAVLFFMGLNTQLVNIKGRLHFILALDESEIVLEGYEHSREFPCTFTVCAKDWPKIRTIIDEQVKSHNQNKIQKKGGR